MKNFDSTELEQEQEILDVQLAGYEASPEYERNLEMELEDLLWAQWW